MTGEFLRRGRRNAGWTQERLAARLGVSQAYVCLMERGRRRVPDRIARAVTRLLRLPASALPVEGSMAHSAATETWVEHALARLGYPGLAYRERPSPKRNPAEVLVRALARDHLDPRLVEALPWLLLRFEGFETETLVGPAKRLDLQNRLGFTVALAREIAEQRPRWKHRAAELRALEESLERSRLAREDGFLAVIGSPRMRGWLRSHRSRTAEHWNLLTDLDVEHLSYAREDQGALARLPS
jgi:transcriptional regulator with XRE-family HTH domain